MFGFFPFGGQQFGQAEGTTGGAAPVSPGFIASTTAVYAPTLQALGLAAPFIASATVLYAPSLVYVGTTPIPPVAGTYYWTAPPGVTQVFVALIGGGGGGPSAIPNTGGGGAGGGAYAARSAVPVTPGTVYTLTVGAGGGLDQDGGASSFTGDGGVQVVAAGGAKGLFTAGTSAQGGQASASTGDSGQVFSGGAGGTATGGPGQSGAGGGASGNRLATGASGASGIGGGVGVGGAGGVGANGGGSGGTGGGYTVANAQNGVAPGGGAGGGGAFENSAVGAPGNAVLIAALVPPFINTNTVVYPPTFLIPFALPFIASKTRVFGVFSIFDGSVNLGPGNGGEIADIQLAPSGTTVTAVLSSPLSAVGSVLNLSGDGGLPASGGFCVRIESEVLYVKYLSPHTYTIVGRARSNTLAASHGNGATVSWTDSYEMALSAGSIIGANFTADVSSTGSFFYEGFMICYDSTQAYLAGNRYPFHVTSFLGIFDAGTGYSGTSRTDGAQPNKVCTPATTSDDCPAAIGNPARLTTSVAVGDVAVLRYTNPEASILTLGSRSAALQSWFGLRRMDAANNPDMSNPAATVIDGVGKNEEFLNPAAVGIAPATGGPTTTAVPYTTTTLLGSTRAYTHGGLPSPPNFGDKGWPMATLAVRNGVRRVPYWQSYDYHNFNYVFSGFATDATYAQLVANRNVGNNAAVGFPNANDITAPNAVWDDGSYSFGVSVYVAIYDSPVLVIGPPIGGTLVGIIDSVVPIVSFPASPASPVFGVPTPPPVEGGSGGGVVPSRRSRFDAHMT